MADKKIDLLKHFLVPEHALLSSEEKQALLDRYNITEIQLPSISKSDTAIKHLNAKPGDVIQITRNTRTEKNTTYYRRVI